MSRPLALLLALTACGGTAATAPPTPPVAAAAPEPPPPDPAPPAVRLPGDVRPRRYALEMTVDPARDRLDGVVRIDAEVVRPTRVVWLSATGLEVASATLAGHPARVLPGGDDFVGLVAPAELPTGPLAVEVAYRAPIDRERSRGVYAVKENDLWYAYTFFEPLDARRAFPCFDEPSYKVPWQLTLHVPAGQQALANAPVASESDEPGGHKVVFAESKPMPSYLVAFVVGPFDLVDGGVAGRAGTRVRFIVTRGRGPETRFAREITPRVVAALEDYFDMPYPFEKLDVAVVPRYWGTMEHPGIVAMGQPLTLIPPDRETRRRREYYTNILAHELAHYWFGDYVTLAWWNDTWLNEALGAWLDRIITDAVAPEWRHGENLREIQSAMRTDSLLAAQPIARQVNSKEGIEASFDNDVTYYKGSSVISMFEHWLPEGAFQRFIRGYVRRHAWGNASRDDFFGELAADVGAGTAAAMRGFFEQPGVPLVEHELRCGASGATLRLRQRRALPADARDSAPRSWTIPLAFRYGAAGKTVAQGQMLAGAEGEVKLEGGCPSWLVMNADGRGYYRSAYSGAELARLFPRRGAPPLTRRERLMALADTASAIERGELRIDDGLALVPVLAADRDERIAVRAHELTSLVLPLHLDEASYARYRRFVLAKFGARARALGWRRGPDDGDELHALRAALVPAVAKAGDPRLAREAGQLARAWLADRAAVDEDLVASVLDVAARQGDRALFDAYVEAARAASAQPDRDRLIRALGDFVDPALAARARELIFGGPFDVRDSSNVLVTQLYNRETRAAAWPFARQNLERLAGSLRGDESARLMAMMMSTFCDRAGRDDAQAAMAPIAARVPGAKNALDKAAERSEQCIARQARNAEDVRRFLSRY